MTTPPIIERPLKSRRRRLTIAVVHSMAEYARTPEGVFYAHELLDRLGLSAHCLATPTGELIECVSTEYTAWHARGYNSKSVGLELLVPGEHDYADFLKVINGRADPYPDVQYKAAAWWFAREMSKWGILMEGLKGHHHLSPERKQDPGRAFNWQKLRQYIEVYQS